MAHIRSLPFHDHILRFARFQQPQWELVPPLRRAATIRRFFVSKQIPQLSAEYLP
jgi:hypothetical protein